MNNNYKGKLLISTPDTTGDIFSRSVVLVIEHCREGAFGLILNKKHRNISARLESIVGFEVNIYEGGPVETDKIFFIVKGKPMSENAIELNDNYYVTEDIETIFTALMDQSLDVQNVKIFAGYSGWSAQQLDGEINGKFWTVIDDAYQLDYTRTNDENLWRHIMQNLGGEFLLWMNTPADVHMN